MLQQTEMESVHCSAFQKVCAIIEDKIIDRQDIMLLKDLKVEYTTALDGTPYANPKYRIENLIAKITKHYGNQLSFVQLGGTKYHSSVVYASSTRLDTFAQNLYQLSNTDKISDVALKLHDIIMRKFKDSVSTIWPPTARDLEQQDDVLPRDLEKFISALITGNVTGPVSAKNNRLVQSLGQDLCRAATRGQWKLPKHILLSMTLRHMFRSCELITLISRMGHCASYSYSAELETALAIMADQNSNLLTNQIVTNPPKNSLFHSDFDNFDQFTASGLVHTAHGIMMQEVGDQVHISAETRERLSMQRTKQRSLDISFSSSELPECYITMRRSPSYTINKWTCSSGKLYCTEFFYHY